MLSGTPLQNRVSELWSLFDFLMPDFLEEESVFNKMYNKYLTGNIKKMQEKLEETESFIQALKSLKRRIAPFILRRTKEQVLKELPPKVIQDWPCTMPAAQAQVHLMIEKKYPFAAATSAKQQPAVKGGEAKKGKSQLFNLILHRKVCNHPVLVQEELKQDKLTDKGEFASLTKSQQHAYQQSGKLTGLVEVLSQCEILKGGGVGPGDPNDDTKTTAANVSPVGVSDSMAFTDVAANVSAFSPD